MRRLMVLLVLMAICTTPVLAAGSGNSLQVQLHTGVTETPHPQVTDAGSKGPGSLATPSGNGSTSGGAVMVQQSGKTEVPGESSPGRNMAMIVQQEQQALDDELSAASPPQQVVLQNQNRVRLAVQVILAACEGEGGNCQQISSIADDLNNSVQATIMAEEQARERNQIIAFFMGGDSEAAAEILRQVEQNQVRLEELTQLIQQANFSEDEISLLQEQIMNMEAEQERLRSFAENENQNNGIFGFLFQ